MAELCSKRWEVDMDPLCTFFSSIHLRLKSSSSASLSHNASQVSESEDISHAKRHSTNAS